jgi:hypothetical protein
MAAQIIVAALSVGALALLVWDCHHSDLVEKANRLSEIFRREE